MHIGLLWPKEDNSITNWCQYQWAWQLLVAGWETSILHKQSPNGSPERICCYWTWVSSYSLGYGKVSPLSVWQSLPTWNWPKAFGDHPIKKLASVHTQMAKDTHQNTSLQFQCALPARLKKPASRLLVQSGGLQDSIKLPKLSVTKLQANSIQEVTVYNNCVKLHKLIIPLPYSSIQYRMGGQVI